jgi:hypothetical protein
MKDTMDEIAGTYCHHYPICIRKILPDETLISMASPSVQSMPLMAGESIPTEHANEHWYSITLSNFEGLQNTGAFHRVCEFLTRSMSRLFRARPHWGKLCPLTPTELRDLYPRFVEFQQISKEFDPNGSFRNRWTDELLSASGTIE